MLSRTPTSRVYALLLTIACAAPAENGPDTSASITVAAEPDLVLGYDDSPGGPFFRVTAAAITSSGHIVVADAGNHRIVVYRPDGTLSFSAGGPGGGPQEFQTLSDVGEWDEDAIYAFDALARRVSLWSLTGEYAGSISLAGEGRARALQRLPDGFALLSVAQGTGPRQVGERAVDSAFVILLDAAGRERRTLLRAPYLRTAAIASPEGSVRITQLPFDAMGVVSLGRRAASIGWSSDSLVQRHSYDGRQVDSIRIPIPARDLSRDVIEAWASARAESTPASDRPRTIAYLAGLPHGERLPRFDRAVEDEEEMIWIREFLSPSDTVASWVLLQPDGSVAQRLTLPTQLELLYVSTDVAVGVVRDELDRELVVRLAVTRS